jgi:hypothetical protein
MECIGMIIRFDDVCSRTDENKLKDLISECSKYGDVWLSVNIFSQHSDKESVYPNVPFKDSSVSSFYKVDEIYFETPMTHLAGIRMCDDYAVVSHGLVHCDHSRISRDAQEMSIVTSCNFLQTDVFVPPFNRFNQDTEDICRVNNIQLAKLSEGWKSMEHNAFDSSHQLWYLHPWRWKDHYELRDYLNASKVNV